MAFIRSIRLENFKAFKDSQPIPLKPITILIGKNSAGKSSILKAILASSQTASSTLPDGSDFRLIGDLTNLGTFSDTIHGGDPEDNFAITFEIGPPPIWLGAEGKFDQNFSFKYSYSSSKSSPLSAKFSGVVAKYGNEIMVSGGRFEKLPGLRHGRPGLRHGRSPVKRAIRAKFNSESIFASHEGDSDSGPELPEIIQEINTAIAEILENNQEEIRENNPLQLWLSDFALDITEKYPTPRKLLGSLFNQFGPTEIASAQINTILAKTIYLGPFRDEPSREARLAQSSGNRVGIRGEDLSTLLHVWRDNEDFMEQFNSHLRSLGIADSARTSASYMKSENGEELETGFVKIMVNKAGTARSLMDLGFGTSQVLPIVFELTLKKNRLILLEQPELHLHPAAQSELGDLLKFSMERGNQLIVETHSANLIERIRKLIRRGELDNNSANIIYIRQDSSGRGICDCIGFNKDGTFADTWPEDDFFGEREREIFDW
jgi:predicted ATPase